VTVSADVLTASSGRHLTFIAQSARFPQPAHNAVRAVSAWRG
jgi:hypothetical protein